MLAKGTVFEFGEFRLDVGERVLIGPGDRRTQLAGRTIEGLRFMLEHAGRLLDKETLMSAVWKDAVVEENSLNQLVVALRKLLGERAANARYIVTVPGSGYRFSMPVTVHSEERNAIDDPRPSIAVLPFEDLSSAKDQAYLADGIAEELLFQFARVDGWRVIGKTSSFQLRGAEARLDLAASRLNADYVLTGAVRREGGRLRVSAQLAETAEGFLRWSGRFERELDDLFRVQDEIASAVVTALRAELGVGERVGEVAGTTNLEAYDVYTRARSIAQRSGRDAMLRSAELYKEALCQIAQYWRASMDCDWAGAATFEGLDLAGNRDAVEHGALHRAWLRDDAAAVDYFFPRYLQHQTVQRRPEAHGIVALAAGVGTRAATAGIQGNRAGDRARRLLAVDGTVGCVRTARRGRRLRVLLAAKR